MKAWKEAQVIHRHGAHIQATTLYAVYAKWCADEGVTPVKMRTWGDHMKKVLRMATFADSGKRTFYTDIAVRASLKVVAG